jgi:serine/threonine protein kinase
MIQGYAYTKAADVWSSGIFLYAMVAGHLPFEDTNVERLLQKVVSTEPDYSLRMSRGLVDFLRRLLCKSPDARITIDRLKEHQWFSQCEYSVLIGFHTAVGCGNECMPPVDRDIIDQIAGLGLDCKELPGALIAHEYSPLTAVYKQFRRYKLGDRMQDLLSKMTLSMSLPRIVLSTTSPDTPQSKDVRVRRRLTAARVTVPNRIFGELDAEPTPRRMSRPIIERPILTGVK